MAEKRVVELEVKTTGAENSEKSVKSLKARLRELKLELQGLDEGSDQFKKLVREAGELQDTIGDLNQQVKNFASDTRRLDATLEGIGAVAGAFGAVESSLALVGVESEELQKTMVRLQAAMTLVNSVQSVANALQKESAFMTSLSTIRTNLLTRATVQQAVATGTATTAQKIMNTVMKANPIFLIIGAVTALVGAYALLTGETENLEESNKKLNESYEKSIELIQKRNGNALQDLENLRAIRESEGASAKELLDLDLKILEQKEKARKEELKKQTSYYKRLENLRQKAIADENWELADKIKQDKVKTRERKEELIKLEKDLATEKKVIINNYNKEEAEKEKEAKDKRKDIQKTANQEYLAAEKKFREQLKADILANEQEQIDKEKVRKEKELKDKEELNDGIYAADQYLKSLQKSDEENELQGITDKYRRLKDLAEANGEDSSILLEAQKNEENAIRTKYDKQARDDKQASDLQEIAMHQAKRDAIIQIAQDTVNMLNSIGQIFINDQKKLEKFNKATALIQIAIDTAKAISSLVAASQANPLNAATFGAAGIAQFASGLAQILANIAKAKQILSNPGSQAPSGGGGGDGGGATPNQVITPNFNIVGQSGANTLGMQTQPLQAYVVSGEVTSQQALDRNRLKNATFG